MTPEETLVSLLERAHHAARAMKEGGITSRGNDAPGGLPLTDRARKAISLAAREARLAGHDHVSTEHLLLGLILEGAGLGSRILKKQGVLASTVYREVAMERGGAA